MQKRRGIGGSDLAAVCALYRPKYAEKWAKYATAADVWMGLVHGVQRPRTAVMQRGIDAEPRLRRAYLDVYGGAMMPKPDPWIVPHPRLPFVSVSPDDVWLESQLREIGIYIEFKSVNWFSLYPPEGRPPTEWGPDDSDEVPDYYGLQVQLGLEILDIEVGHLFAGFGRDTVCDDGSKQFLYSESRRYVIHRDRELMGWCLELAERFHREHVLTRTPPSVAPKNSKREWSRLMKEQSWKATEAQPSP